MRCYVRFGDSIRGIPLGKTYIKAVHTAWGINDSIKSILEDAISRKMDTMKSQQFSNTVKFSSLYFSVAVCFVALIHVEIELQTHRQMLHSMTTCRQGNHELRDVLTSEKNNIATLIQRMNSLDSSKGS